MRLPVRHIAGNIIWTTQGSVWALWRVTAVNYTHASRSAKQQRLEAIEGLVKSLTGEPMLLSLCPQVDPASVVRNMISGIDLEASPRYTDVAHRVLDQLQGLELTGRTDWLAVPLPHPTWRDAAGAVVAAARADLARTLSLMPAPITVEEEVARIEQAARLQATWPPSVAMRAASEAEILWIYGHSARRGVVEPLLPDAGTDRAFRGRVRGVAAVSEAILAEGGADDAQARRELPWKRRHVQVSTEWGTSYQALLALAEMPKTFAFPGCEYLAVLDGFDFPIDWVARLHLTPGAKAEVSTRRKSQDVAYQRSEHDDNPTGAPADVEQAPGELVEYRARLTANNRELEVRAMVALCVWGTTAEEADERAQVLTNYFSGESRQYTLARPLGKQEALWYGMLPACRTPGVMVSYSQYLLARDFAMALPFCGSHLGDETGALYGLQMTGGGVRPVLVDYAAALEQDLSASAAFLGELGSGKSVAMKTSMHAVLSTGRRTGRPGSRGRAVVVDRTHDQEWVRFARACPGTTQVITVNDQAALSLDPLRVFTGKEAARFTASFLTLLLGVPPMDDEGVTLSEAIDRVLAGPSPSMHALTKHLAVLGEDDPAARMLARKLAAVARKDLARVVFDPTLPVVEVADADSIVFAVSELQMPKKGELSSDWRLQRMEFEKVLGRAALYLIAALCRKIAYASKDEFAAVVWDECWWLTSSPEGLELLLEVLRDGRKHGAGALVGSHDAEDIGPSDTERGIVIRGLIRRWHLFRHTNTALARRGLEALGLDPGDEDLVEQVRKLSPAGADITAEERALRAGECLYRDLPGRVGGMKVLIPFDEQAAATIHSTPGRAA